MCRWVSAFFRKVEGDFKSEVSLVCPRVGWGSGRLLSLGSLMMEVFEGLEHVGDRMLFGHPTDGDI